MSDLKEITMCLAASIWHQPATFDELYKRKIDVLKHASEYMFNTVLMSAKSKGWIYEKDNTWYCYKKTVKEVLNPSGFEIELNKDTRSEFRKQFDRIHGI